MRAAHGDTATFRLGQRYPITNGTFAPIFNSPQIGQVLGANTFVAPFPSISYEDLGLTLKAKPAIHAGTDVTLDLDMEIKSLGGQAFNGIPVINNRQYKSVITVKNYETAVIAGMLTRNESRTLAGMPGFGRIPVLGRAVANGTTERGQSELLMVITPHIISARPGTEAGYIPLRRE
jgi:type II secretory pathway component GspD/PulD (secretin)